LMMLWTEFYTIYKRHGRDTDKRRKERSFAGMAGMINEDVASVISSQQSNRAYSFGSNNNNGYAQTGFGGFDSKRD